MVFESVSSLDVIVLIVFEVDCWFESEEGLLVTLEIVSLRPTTNGLFQALVVGLIGIEIDGIVFISSVE